MSFRAATTSRASFCLQSSACACSGESRGLDGWVGWLVLAELGLIAVISLALAHSAVGTWATYDQAGVELADTVGKLRAGGCRVEVTGLDLERTAAVRALTGEIPARRSCRRAYVVVASGRPPDCALLGTCDKRPLERWRLQGGRRGATPSLPSTQRLGSACSD